ncbi:MAG: hypothetical protein QG620_871 [Patescibacteria group bacterium]|nr:hypothetical protein [Patescibacteria group bacterium]
MKKTCQNITWWIGVVTVGIVFGVTLQFAAAWVNPPAAAPPGGNLGGPINTGSITQTRAGTLFLEKALGVEGVLIAYANLIVEGTLRVVGADGNSGSFLFRDGNQKEGRVLTSNDNGLVRWDDAVVPGGVYGYCAIETSCSSSYTMEIAPCSCGDGNTAECGSGYYPVKTGTINVGNQEGGATAQTYVCVKN